MHAMLAGLALHMAGGLGALLCGSRRRLAQGFGLAGVLAGALASGLGALQSLTGRAPGSLSLPWSLPLGRLSVGIDPLSALFLIPVWVVAIASAIYGVEYLGAQPRSRRLGAHWLFFNTLVASMTLLLVARNAVPFLVGWELMTLASFFLVSLEHEREEVQRAGWLYLVASHLGTALLLVFFLVMDSGSGTLEFEDMGAAGHGGRAALCFVLAAVGFGTKAGFLPVHVWLPEAHPAAPSHVSALMSGVMIKTGIYGLLRAMLLLGPLQAWWGHVLLVIGLSSGVVGVLFALAQHDLKRLLAWHSVENVGIIALGLGLGVLGASSGHPALAALGFAGGLLHVVNHALFKGLLFLSAGAVLHSTHTRNLEELGGLMRKMRFSATAFLLGSIAIVGLPPLNGFVSELLIYSGALHAGARAPMSWAAPAVGAAAGLALIGGLAAACFAKAFGVVFLGTARSPHAEHAADPRWPMKTGMAILAVGCIAIGLAGPWLLGLLAPVVAQMSGLSLLDAAAELHVASGVLRTVVLVSAFVLATAAGLWLLRARLLAGRTVRRAPTWDCGYARPTARMQYTASSFADPLLQVFAPLVLTRKRTVLPTGHFPRDGEYHSHARDLWKEDIFGGLFRRVAGLLARLHWIQQGKVQLYVLYVVVILVLLLLWKLD